MNKFNPDTTCPKCGHDKIASTWHELENAYQFDNWVEVKPERITRRCERCNYMWDELPFDKE